MPDVLAGGRLMPRRTYSPKKGRGRPSDQQVDYSKLAALLGARVVGADRARDPDPGGVRIPEPAAQHVIHPGHADQGAMRHRPHCPGPQLVEWLGQRGDLMLRCDACKVSCPRPSDQEVPRG